MNLLKGRVKVTGDRKNFVYSNMQFIF